MNTLFLPRPVVLNHRPTDIVDVDMVCLESIDDEAMVDVEMPARPSCESTATLKALQTRMRVVSTEKMLAATYYTHDFAKWVEYVWTIVDLCKFNEQVGHVAVRTFGVYMSTCALLPWPMLKWERYAALWIAIKLDECDSDIAFSVDSFLEAMLGTNLPLNSERVAMYKAELKVLRANNFSMSFPTTADFADVLLDVLGSTDRTTVFKLLRGLTHQKRYVTRDPFLIATVCVHHTHPEHSTAIVDSTGISLEDIYSCE